jgi:hypothetical protein
VICFRGYKCTVAKLINSTVRMLHYINLKILLLTQFMFSTNRPTNYNAYGHKLYSFVSPFVLICTNGKPFEIKVLYAFLNYNYRVIENSSKPFLTHGLFVKNTITLRTENNKQFYGLFSVGNVHRVQRCMHSLFSSCLTQPGKEFLCRQTRYCPFV